MAAPTTPSRRVLGRLDHNTALLSSTAKTFKSPGKQPALSPRKVAHGVDDAHGVIFATRRSPEVPRSGLKRKLDFVYVDPDVLEGEKRVRIAGEMEPVGSDEERIINAAGEGMDALDDLRSSTDSAPSSQRDDIFDTTAIESQNTTMTEADGELATSTLPVPRLSSRSAAARSVLTAEQARSTATTLRLRLQLSMYKIRTNQISVPLDELSIIPSHRQRNTSSTSQPPPPSRAIDVEASSSNSSGSTIRELTRTPLPAATCAVEPTVRTRPQSADALLKAVTSDGRHKTVAFSSSSPVRSQEPKNSPAKMLNTPMLPRTSGVGGRGRNPETDAQLTSSVVKGRAADGLLRLMGAL